MVQAEADRKAFEAAEALAWQAVFHDSCTGDWRGRWHLDGKTDALPAVTEGRIGLRHMWTRGARYRDIRVAVREEG